MQWTPRNKQIATAVGIGVGLVVLYLVFKPGSDNSGLIEDPTGNNPDPLDPDQSGGFEPSLAAERLFDAMNRLGTDEDAIMGVFQTVSVANAKKVWAAFGKRPYNDNLGNDFVGPWGTLTKRDLTYWLKSELSAGSLETIRIKYKSTNLI